LPAGATLGNRRRGHDRIAATASTPLVLKQRPPQLLDMRIIKRGAALLALLLAAACGNPAPQHQAGQSWFDASGAYRGPRLAIAPDGPPTRAAATTSQPIILPMPEVPPVAPAIEGSATTRAPYLYRPGPATPPAQYGEPLNPGPITGWGPGGMA